MIRPLDLIFMGTPDFAATILAVLIASGHRLRAVYSQPPRPAGRGHRLQPSPVQILAERHGISVRCPQNLRDAEVQSEFAAVNADAAVVAAYGLILPPAILTAPLFGCLNIHASLLPRWRGAAPVQRAILAGDETTGITIMQMDEGLDTGPILLREAIAIGAKANSGELTALLAQRGAALTIAALDAAAAGNLRPQPQPQEGVVYAKKLRREEALLDWRRDAPALERQVRAFDPWPGAAFTARGERIRVVAADAVASLTPTEPGTVLSDRLTIACGAGALQPLRLQRPGRSAQDADEFLRGFPIPPGTILPCPVIG